MKYSQYSSNMQAWYCYINLYGKLTVKTQKHSAIKHKSNNIQVALLQ